MGEPELHVSATRATCGHGHGGAVMGPPQTRPDHGRLMDQCLSLECPRTVPQITSSPSTSPSWPIVLPGQAGRMRCCRWRCCLEKRGLGRQPWQPPRYPSHTDCRQPVRAALSGGGHKAQGRSPSPSITCDQSPLTSLASTSRWQTAHQMILSRISPPRHNAQPFRASHHLLSGSQ